MVGEGRWSPDGGNGDVDAPVFSSGDHEGLFAVFGMVGERGVGEAVPVGLVDDFDDAARGADRDGADRDSECECFADDDIRLGR